MKFMVNVDFFRCGGGYSHTETLEEGTANGLFSAADWRSAWEAECGPLEDSESWADVTVRFYRDGDDPLFDSPFHVSTDVDE